MGRHDVSLESPTLTFHLTMEPLTSGYSLQLNRLVSSAPSMLLEVMMLMFRVWYSDAAASEVAHDSFAFPEALYFRQLVPGMDNNQQM